MIDRKNQIFKENIFDQIISDLQSEFEYKSEKDFTKFLKELKPIMEKLADDIRKRDKVRIDYKDHKVQICYVFRYMHIYWHQIYNSFEIIKESNPSFFCTDYGCFRNNYSNISKSTQSQEIDIPNLEVGLFGAGPAPEIIGLTRFLERYKENIENLFYKKKVCNFSLHLFDEIEDWDFSRKTFLLSNDKKRYISRLGLKLQSKKFDFFDLNDFYAIEECSIDVAYFQNCINEFAADIKNRKKKFELILDAIRPGGYLIFSDRSIRETVCFLDWFEDRFLNEDQLGVVHEKRSKLNPDYPEGRPLFGGYHRRENLKVPDILMNGNFYSSVENPMMNNKYDLYILKKKALIKDYHDVIISDFFIIEEEYPNFTPLNSKSPYNNLFGSFEKINFLREKRLENFNMGKPLNSGLPESSEEKERIKKMKENEKDFLDIVRYFQRSESVIKEILRD